MSAVSSEEVVDAKEDMSWKLLVSPAPTLDRGAVLGGAQHGRCCSFGVRGGKAHTSASRPLHMQVALCSVGILICYADRCAKRSLQASQCPSKETACHITPVS